MSCFFGVGPSKLVSLPSLGTKLWCGSSDAENNSEQRQHQSPKLPLTTFHFWSGPVPTLALVRDKGFAFSRWPVGHPFPKGVLLAHQQGGDRGWLLGQRRMADVVVKVGARSTYDHWEVRTRLAGPNVGSLS